MSEATSIDSSQLLHEGVENILSQPIPSNAVRSGSSSHFSPKRPVVSRPLAAQESSNAVSNLLSEEQNSVFQLMRDGLNYQQVSDRLGIPKGSVRNYYSLAQRRLRESKDTNIEPALYTLPPYQERALIIASQGKTREEIALEMGVAPQTIKNSMEEMTQKLGVSSVVEGVMRGMDVGIIDPTNVIPETFRISSLATLTPKQRILYDNLVKDSGFRTYSQIGHDLGMAEQNVKNVASEIWKKIGIRNRDQAVMVNYALQLQELRQLTDIESADQTTPAENTQPAA